MKKLLLVLVVLGMFAVPVFAQEDTGPAWFSTEVNNSNGTYLSTTVSATNIYPADRIMGYSITIYNPAKSAEMVAALYDTSSVSDVSAEVIAENEAAPGGTDFWFPYPRKCSNGITVRQGPNTRVTIYFVR